MYDYDKEWNSDYTKAEKNRHVVISEDRGDGVYCSIVAEFPYIAACHDDYGYGGPSYSSKVYYSYGLDLGVGQKEMSRRYLSQAIEERKITQTGRYLVNIAGNNIVPFTIEREQPVVPPLRIVSV